MLGLAVLCLFGPLNAQTRPGSLRGVVTDAKSGETFPFVNIIIKSKEGNVVAGGTTDFDGKYNINPVLPGTYDVEASFTGYSTITIKDVLISPNTPTVQNFKMQEESEMLDEVVISYEAPLIDKTKSSKITTYDHSYHPPLGSPSRRAKKIESDEVVEMAVRDVTSVAAQAAGVTVNADGGINLRGCRTEGTVYFIDGVKVRGSANIPQAAISQTEVISGGLPAQFGDHPNPLYDYDVHFVSPDFIEYPKAVKSKPEEKTARILTAGELHDFSKWKLWEDFSEDEFKIWKDHWGIMPLNRYSVQVNLKNSVPLIDAEVKLISEEGETIFKAKTDNTGKAELWNGLFEKPAKIESIEVSYHDEQILVSNPEEFQNGLNFIEVDAPCEIATNMDVCFVVDATGSMGDEISYLQAELQDVITRTKASLKGIDIRLSSVFYRDNGDEYVTKKHDFDDNIDHGIKFIKQQSAGGGGDYPEAVIPALDAAINELSWSSQAASRILFLILDAPPHHDAEKVKELHSLISAAAQKGIRIVPVASSGIDKSTEYLLRSMALVTNGTYTFLTDHSGVGNPHIEPTTDSYEVELLNDLLERLIHQFAFTPECPSEVALITENSDSTTSGNIDTSLTEPLGQTSPKEFPSISLDERFNWQYYPNPTRDIVRIQFNTEIKEVFLTDLRGKLLTRKSLNGEQQTEFDLSRYPVGTYFIKFIFDDKWVTDRVIRTY